MLARLRQLRNRHCRTRGGLPGTWRWLVLSIVVSVFLLGAAGNHILEMVRDKNCAPGNSVILLHDIGPPVHLWALIAAGAEP